MEYLNMSGKIVAFNVNLVLYTLKPRIQRYNSAYAVKNIKFSVVLFVCCSIVSLTPEAYMSILCKTVKNVCSLYSIVYLFPSIHNDVKYKSFLLFYSAYKYFYRGKKYVSGESKLKGGVS